MKWSKADREVKELAKTPSDPNISFPRADGAVYRMHGGALLVECSAVLLKALSLIDSPHKPGLAGALPVFPVLRLRWQEDEMKISFSASWSISQSEASLEYVRPCINKQTNK